MSHKDSVMIAGGGTNELPVCKTCRYLYVTKEERPRLMCVRPLNHEEDNWTPILVERTGMGCGSRARYHSQVGNKEEA